MYKNKKYSITAGVLIALIIIGIVYAETTQKPAPAPVQITWLPASALPTGESIKNFTWFTLQDNTIYCMGNPIPEVDAATFVVSSIGDYGKDKIRVYWCSQVVANADPATFVELNKEYAKDKTHVYWEGYYTLPDANPTTFTVVPSPGSSDNMQTGYGKDDKYVYSLYQKLPNADPGTFTLSPVPNDKNWIYQNDTVIGPKSLLTYNVLYAKALPAECNKPGADTIYPQVYPPAFSTDESVIGYPNDNAICVIDKNTNTIQLFPYGTQQGVSLSKDGTKVLYFKYQKGDGEGEQTCADCGQYSLDRTTGKVLRVQ